MTSKNGQASGKVQQVNTLATEVSQAKLDAKNQVRVEKEIQFHGICPTHVLCHKYVIHTQ